MSVYSSSETSLLLPETSPSDPPLDWQTTFRIARPFVFPSTLLFRLAAILSLLCELLRRAVELLPGYAAKLLVDSLSADDIPNNLWLIAALFVGARIFGSLLNTSKSILYSAVESAGTTRFSVALIEHLLGLSMEFHVKRKSGEILRVWDKGVGAVDSLVETTVFGVFPTLLEAAVVTIVFIKLKTPGIAVTIFTTVIFYFLFTIFMTRWRNKYRRHMNELDDAAGNKAIDTLINYETVKTFASEKRETSEISVLENGCRDAFMAYHISSSLMNLGQDLILNAGLGVVVVLAILSAISGITSPGSFVLILTYTQQIFEPLLQLGTSYRAINEAVTDLEKCVKLFKVEPVVVDHPNAIDIRNAAFELNGGSHRGSLEFRNVCFSYTAEGAEKDGQEIIKNLSFYARPGDTTAIVGPSGSGKSTLVKLLLRLYDVNNGSVLVNGKDIREVTQVSLREEIGVVSQDTVLFNDSLRVNIAYGKRDATDDEILNAVKKAALGPFVEKLPEGLDTIVGERGVRLSGGEKQRVGIARCIIKNPSIVVLDEASSALDSLTEKEMRRNMKFLCDGRTTLVIAHRLSTIKEADRICVLGKKGSMSSGSCIIEEGTHSELLQRDGAYAEMWKALF